MKRSFVFPFLLSFAALGAKGGTITVQEINPFDYVTAFSFAPGSNVADIIASPVGKIAFTVGGSYDGLGNEDFGFSVVCWALGPNGVASATAEPAGTWPINASDGESWFTDYDDILTDWGAGGIFNANFDSNGVSGTGTFFFSSVLSYPNFPNLSDVVTNQIPPIPEKGELPWEAAAVAMLLFGLGMRWRGDYLAHSPDKKR